MYDNSKKSKTILEHWQAVTALLVVYDFLAVVISYFAALWIRFDCRFSHIALHYLESYYHTIIWHGIFCIIVFAFMRLYKSIWRFASYSELLRTIVATAITSVVYIILTVSFGTRMPVSYYIFGTIMQFCMTLGVRFSYRFVILLRKRRRNTGTENEKRVMLVGAGNAGQMIYRDIKAREETNERVCCFIDDNQNKWGRYIDNVPVFGGRDSIMEAVAKFEIDKIYVAIPSANPKDKRDILAICNETSCELMNLPGMYQLYTGEVTVNKMKPVSD